MITFKGCKPIPRSFSNWNLRKLEPDSVTRAKDILNVTKNETDNSNTPRGRKTGESVITISTNSRDINSSKTKPRIRSSVLPRESHPLA